MEFLFQMFKNNLETINISFPTYHGILTSKVETMDIQHSTGKATEFLFWMLKSQIFNSQSHRILIFNVETIDIQHRQSNGILISNFETIDIHPAKPRICPITCVGAQGSLMVEWCGGGSWLLGGAQGSGGGCGSGGLWGCEGPWSPTVGGETGLLLQGSDDSCWNGHHRQYAHEHDGTLL